MDLSIRVLTEHEMVEAEEANCFIPIELNGEDNVKYVI